MTSNDLKVGGWYYSPKSKSQLFRYDGKVTDGTLVGAYVFSKFNSRDPNTTGEVVTIIEIFSLDDLEPWESKPEA